MAIFPRSDLIDGFGTAQLEWTPIERSEMLGAKCCRPTAALAARVVKLEKEDPDEAAALLNVILQHAIGWQSAAGLGADDGFYLARPNRRYDEGDEHL